MVDCGPCQHHGAGVLQRSSRAQAWLSEWLVGEEGTAGGAQVPDGVLGVAKNSRLDSMSLNYQDCEELFPASLDVDAGDHGIWFESQEGGALNLATGETDSETAVRGVVKNVDLDVVSFLDGLSCADKR